ncbi:MbtH family protein [Streptomyces sp. NPDC058623]|uniref:MbtH family protein n=1 Tax=Streptomyces sp. NPDC058623 TaxID=3346563 RepID=UPI00364EE651
MESVVEGIKVQGTGVVGRFVIVLNDEEQYSIWSEGRELPEGWREAGFAGTKEECLARVEEVWTDQRPLSVRPDAAS